MSSLKKYMITDLILLGLLGCLLEGLVTKFAGEVFNGTPTTTVSLLLMMIAVARWKLWGLVLAPFLAGATLVGGQFNSMPWMAATYTWQVFLASFMGLLTAGFDVIFYQKFKTNKIIGNTYAFLGIMVMNFILFNLVFFLVYRLSCSGTLGHSGYSPYVMYEEVDGAKVARTINLCFYAESSGIYNLFGAVVLGVGGFLLRSQKVVCNVADRLVEDKEEAEKMRVDSEFKIAESEDELNDTSDSSKNQN